MQINSTEHSNDLVEHRFTVGDIPGILWIPASATPTSIITWLGGV